MAVRCFPTVGTQLASCRFACGDPSDSVRMRILASASAAAGAAAACCTAARAYATMHIAIW